MIADPSLMGKTGHWLTSEWDQHTCEHQIALLALTGSAGIRCLSVALASQAPEQIGRAR